MKLDKTLLDGVGHLVADLRAQRQAMGPLGILVGCAALLAVAYMAYLRMLPKPLPGFPYNEESANRILGDFPLIWRQLRSRDLRGFINSLNGRHNSRIVQVLVRPVLPAALVVSDYLTTQEILLRRSKEFDRPRAMTAALQHVLPHHHIAMATTDPQFRKNRELVRDLMTPNFLHTVNAPEIWRCTAQFVELWRLKARAARGRPFEAVEDVNRMAFDIIRNAAVGKGEGTLIGTYTDQIRSELGEGGAHPALQAEAGGPTTAAEARDVAYPFPPAPYDETVEAQYRMGEALTPATPIPPRIYHAYNNRTRYMRDAYAIKERMLRKQVSLAVKRMEAGEPLESALDYMIKREIGAAKKQQREPVFDSPYMFDELYGYLGAGHDTTATTLEWGMKHLALHPEAQQKTKENLRCVYKDAYAERRQPSVEEIVKTPAPWVEAVIEEILRLSGPVPATARQATVDTVVLGRPVPKGTTVFLAMHGPGFTAPSVTGPDDVGGGGGGNDKPYSFTKRDNWDGMNPEAFEPERWLVRGDDGSLEYDSQAGPMLAFSLGIRGCFGRRLAYLTLRIIFTLLMWNFELERVPEELDDWKAVQVLTRKPLQCYVRLRVSDY